MCKLFQLLILWATVSQASLRAASLKFLVSHHLPGTTRQLQELEYSLINFSLQRNDGQWFDLPGPVVKAGLAQSAFTLDEIPPATYKAMRFDIGTVTPGANFFTLAGTEWRAGEKPLPFKLQLNQSRYHIPVQLVTHLRLKDELTLNLRFDLRRLLGFPRPIDFKKHGASCDGPGGIIISCALVANGLTSFEVEGVKYPAGQERVYQVPERSTRYDLNLPPHIPSPHLPADNPLTREKVRLGDLLFHDSFLSPDNTVSCMGCHFSGLAFADDVPISPGFAGAKGIRNSMPLFNLAWKSSFFWDGRSPSIRDQVLKPIQEPHEMNSNLNHLVYRMNKNAKYSFQFEKVFGAGPVTKDKLALALEAYIISLTSHNSKFDQAMAGKVTLTEEEQHGMDLFFTDYDAGQPHSGAGCFRCHGGAHFTDNRFRNNGLRPSGDTGRHRVTGKEQDLFTFVTPSLRNIELTPQYMYDGHLDTLEKVLQHYSGPLHRSASLDPVLQKLPEDGMQLSKKDQNAIIRFLKTLTDRQYEDL